MTRTQTETWKSITGYEGIYEVSDTGKVKSIYYKRTKKEIILTPCIIQGYSLYKLVSLDGKRKWHRANRLVAIQFIPNPENKLTVNHKDGNKLNNTIDNLEWATPLENTTHAIKTGLRDTRGQKHPMTNIIDDEVIFMRNVYVKRKNAGWLMRLFDISKNQLNDIVKRRTWSHV